MDTMTPDIEKLDALVAWATAEDAKREKGLPSEWRQTFWTIVTMPDDDIMAHCGTACCIAGKVVADAGALPVLPYYVFTEDFSRPRPGAMVRVADAVYPDGNVVFIAEEAMRLLGLSQLQADVLFEGGNELHDIVRIVDEIKAGNKHPAWREGADPDDYNYSEED